jgi:hypothetical protein
VDLVSQTLKHICVLKRGGGKKRLFAEKAAQVQEVLKKRLPGADQKVSNDFIWTQLSNDFVRSALNMVGKPVDPFCGVGCLVSEAGHIEPFLHHLLHCGGWLYTIPQHNVAHIAKKEVASTLGFPESLLSSFIISEKACVVNPADGFTEDDVVCFTGPKVAQFYGVEIYKLAALPYPEEPQTFQPMEDEYVETRSWDTPSTALVHVNDEEAIVLEHDDQLHLERWIEDVSPLTDGHRVTLSLPEGMGSNGLHVWTGKTHTWQDYDGEYDSELRGEFRPLTDAEWKLLRTTGSIFRKEG